MFERKTRILGIAPYESMKSLMQRLASERNDIELDTFVGDLNEGVRIVQQNLHNDYDVIISRGGTASLIEATTSVPVVEVSLSVYDILRAIKLAENYANRYAIVGFPRITDSAHTLSSLLQYQIDIFTIHNEDEVFDTLTRLKKKGYRMVLCDMIANTIAKQLGLNAILITSGVEGIQSAFDQAVKLSKNFHTLKEENKLLNRLLEGNPMNTIILTEHGEVAYCSGGSLTLPDALMASLKKELPTILSQKNHKFFKNLEGTLYSFICQEMTFGKQRYGVCYFSSVSVPSSLNRHGLQYLSLAETEDLFFQNVYSSTASGDHLIQNLSALNQTSAPVMLLGETGSGKEQAARILYSSSSLKHNPFIVIDCGLIQDKSWNFITNHYNSPLNDNHNTLFFKNIHKLPEKRLHQLLSIAIDMNLCKRNRIIFSCSPNTDGKISDLAMQFVNLLSCITIRLPALRDCKEEIPTLSSLYLNQLNVALASQIIGFEPEAMERMQAYHWPYNFLQFKRVLHELVLITTTPYIQAGSVEALLKKEDVETAPPAAQAAGGCVLDLKKTLNQLDRDIILQVLKETGGNQSAAAKRLGISRTTLWRYLK